MRKMIALGAALVLASSIAGAQGPGYGYGYGPGMMGGGGGPGMMRGYGGYGPGMMGSFSNLTEEQQEKIFAIREEHRRKNWDAMSKMRAEQFKLQRMYNAETVDSKAILEQQKKVDDLRRQHLASRLDMRKQVESVLTPEQRKQFRQSGPWWLSDDE